MDLLFRILGDAISLTAYLYVTFIMNCLELVGQIFGGFIAHVSFENFIAVLLAVFLIFMVVCMHVFVIVFIWHVVKGIVMFFFGLVKKLFNFITGRR